MLAQRLRRQPNIKTSLFQRVVLAGMCAHINLFPAKLSNANFHPPGAVSRYRDIQLQE